MQTLASELSTCGQHANTLYLRLLVALGDGTVALDSIAAILVTSPPSEHSALPQHAPTPHPAKCDLRGFAIIFSLRCSSISLLLSCLPCSKTIVKLALAYAALALSLSTVTALHVRTLCTCTHEPGSGDVEL